MERKSDTGLSVLVVGAGIAGLAFSIEAHRQGHEVKILEKRENPGDYGKPSNAPTMLKVLLKFMV
jgi:2-polyprenyl-6-methoxyphenol hydroxylase-like FAD-dependent oxidoreductase